MSRTLSAPLVTHVAGTAHTRCRMLLFVLRDGTKIGITDHDEDIAFSLPEAAGWVDYLAGTGFRISDVEIPINLDPGNYEVTGPIDAVVTLPQLLGGRWRRAITYLFEVNWQAPAAAIDLMKGVVTMTGPVGGEFKFEVQDDRHKLNQVVGYSITNQCRRDFAACCVNIAPETTTTVASITSELTLTVAATITAADFVGGKAWFTDGPLAGNDPKEIFKVTGSTLEFFEPWETLAVIGNTIVLKEGCDGTLEECRDRFSNAINRRAFDAVPGSQALLPAIPGQGN